MIRKLFPLSFGGIPDEPVVTCDKCGCFCPPGDQSYEDDGNDDRTEEIEGT